MKEKEKVILMIEQLIDQRINEARISLEAAKESRDRETKSSAGDKYETGRSMVQIEMVKFQNQMEKLLKMKNAIGLIKVAQKTSSVKVGSLVVTDRGKYMISVGLGVVDVDNEQYYVISLASPIGKLLEGKKVGDVLDFQGKEINVLEIQ